MACALHDAKPIKTVARPDGDFVDLGYRPVFKEHEREGVKFGKRAMERIVERNNSRIEDTGDFAPLVIGHTDDNADNAPEVIGFVGPYRLGKVGTKSPKWAIFGRCRVYKADADKVRKYPRLSVEYWADSKDPTAGYFDPISLLGAETPELDLGVHYAKSRSPQLMRYSKQKFRFAAMPGGSNTFVPGSVGDEKPKNYSKGAGMLTPEDLQQIIEALKPVVQEAVALAGAGGESEGLPAGDDLAGAGEVAPVDGDAPEVPVEGGDAPPAPEAAGETPPSFDDADDELDEVEDDDEAEQYEAASDPAGGMVAKYAKERDEYKTKYRKEVAARRDAEAARDKYKARVDAAERDGQKAARYAKLKDLESQGYQLDIDEELADCEPMAADRFEKHLEKIASRYAKVPLAGVNTKATPIPRAKTADGTPEDEKRAKYAKQAGENVLAARERGEKIEYKAEYDRLVAAESTSAA